MRRRAFVAGLGAAAIGAGLRRTDAVAADAVRLGHQVNIWGSLSVVALKSGMFGRKGSSP
jgi:hypothetical protein